ncbi:unnamed protein product [Sphagnum troendelagicum]|uniref:Uncharacterized protein n=1 Tax=Sphagnum troendelagicum TaxID=128251 RepID=A0ABP0V3D2_9BRYO
MMVLDAASLLCPFTVVSDIFVLKKDTAKQYHDNARFNVLNNASMAVYQVALAKNGLVMGFKTNNSPIDLPLSKMEAAVENIVSLAALVTLQSTS